MNIKLSSYELRRLIAALAYRSEPGDPLVAKLEKALLLAKE